MSAAQFYIDLKEWPDSTSELDSGFSSLVEKMASKEEMKKEPVFGRFNDKFRIEEIVPMKDGISYKLTYLKFSEEFKGLIFLSEGSTLDEIIDSQHVSKNFSDAMNAVPF